MRRLTILVVIAAMALGLSACGRKGKLIAPEDSTYPRTYPDVSFPPAPESQNGSGRGGTESQFR